MASNIERYAAWPIAIALVISSLFISYAIGEFGSPDRFVEVKGPRDRLSEQQVAWLRDLEAEGAAVAVLRVREPNIRSECLI